MEATCFFEKTEIGGREKKEKNSKYKRMEVKTNN